MTCHRPHDGIIIFLRAPRKGTVKTRLACVLGDDTVLDLYMAFVRDVMTASVKTDFPVRLFFDPHDGGAEIRDHFQTSLPLHPQEGSDLGEKMGNAFMETFDSGWSRAILIGTDCPQITPRVLSTAMDELRQSAMVIGPSLDGGYYLIGFNKEAFRYDIFRDMEWGTERVLTKTLKRAESHGLSVGMSAEVRDIDTIEDLTAYYHSQMSLSAQAYSATMTRLLSSPHLATYFSLTDPPG